MTGWLWKCGEVTGLFRLGGPTLWQVKRNQTLRPFANARTPADRWGMRNSCIAWRRWRSGVWPHKSVDPEKRSLRIAVKANSRSNLSNLMLSQSASSVCPRNFCPRNFTKFVSTKFGEFLHTKRLIFCLRFVVLLVGAGLFGAWPGASPPPGLGPLGLLPPRKQRRSWGFRDAGAAGDFQEQEGTGSF
jgi:hypothetical protein